VARPVLCVAFDRHMADRKRARRDEAEFDSKDQLQPRWFQVPRATTSPMQPTWCTGAAPASRLAAAEDVSTLTASKLPTPAPTPRPSSQQATPLRVPQLDEETTPEMAMFWDWRAGVPLEPPSPALPATDAAAPAPVNAPAASTAAPAADPIVRRTGMRLRYACPRELLLLPQRAPSDCHVARNASSSSTERPT